ncbi:MAG: HEAT repeat domain-containing protein [Verrucomicrobiota bacterium]
MKSLWLVLLLLLFLAGCSKQNTAKPVNEPTFEGKKLGAWLRERKELPDGTVVLSPSAKTAVLSLGTNSLPWLVAELKLRDGSQYGPRADSYDRHQMAVLAFEVLGPKASPAARELLPMFDVLDNYNDGRYSAITVLQCIGPSAVPVLLVALKHPDGETRSQAALALGYVGPPAVSAVRELVGLLKDPYFRVRASGAKALGLIKAQPDLVVPALRELFQTAPAFVANPPPNPVVVRTKSGESKVVMATQRTPIPHHQWQFIMEIRIAAVEALGNYGKDAAGALPDLNAFLQRPKPADPHEEAFDRSVRAAIRNAVPRINGAAIPKR